MNSRIKISAVNDSTVNIVLYIIIFYFIFTLRSIDPEG